MCYKEDKEEMKIVPYASVVGSLMYAMVCTRSDIAHAVGVVSPFMSNPGKEHQITMKWTVWYLMATSRVCLCFGFGYSMLDGYTYANVPSDIYSGKSTFAYLMTFVGVIFWQSNYKSVLRCQPLRPSILQPLKHGRNYYG